MSKVIETVKKIASNLIARKISKAELDDRISKDHKKLALVLRNYFTKLRFDDDYHVGRGRVTSIYRYARRRM